MKTGITNCFGNLRLLLTQTGTLYQPGGGVGEGDGREIEEVGVVCIPMADSC